MKLSLPALAFLFVLLAASTATEPCGENDRQEGSSCRQEMMQHSIDRCRSYLRQGLQQGALISSVVDIEDDDGDAAAPQECCAQLGQLSEHCRCASIRDMLQEVKWEEGFRGQECRGRCAEMVMRGKLLPEKCNLRPHTCKMRMGRV